MTDSEDYAFVMYELRYKSMPGHHFINHNRQHNPHGSKRVPLFSNGTRFEPCGSSSGYMHGKHLR